MRTILKILIVSFLLCTTAEARNEYLNDGTNSCDQGSWEAYSEVRQHEYKTGTNDESQTQVLGFRWRKSIGPVCDEEFAEQQRLKQKLKTQLELVKECKRVPKIKPVPFLPAGTFFKFFFITIFSYLLQLLKHVMNI